MQAEGEIRSRTGSTGTCCPDTSDTGTGTANTSGTDDAATATNKAYANGRHRNGRRHNGDKNRNRHHLHKGSDEGAAVRGETTGRNRHQTG